MRGHWGDVRLEGARCGGVGGRWRGRLGGLRGGRCGGRGCGSSNGKAFSKVNGKMSKGGVYYSVGFLEELIFGGGPGERMPVAVGIVTLEELIEGRGYVGHWRCLGKTDRSIRRQQYLI